MKTLYEELVSYSNQNILPCHMPGHKRKSFGFLPEDFVALDVTEVEGTDNLHDPQGILKAAMERAAGLCHARETYFLVNGSTVGILAAVSAAVPEGGTLLCARTSHKSVYHAIYLRGLKAEYLYGRPCEAADLTEPPEPEELAEALERCPQAKAVLITSPTYEGRIAKVRELAQLAHAHGLPLIVDEAHGAHLGWSKSFPESACEAGADLVIQSTHKTLPAPTQTALLHRNSDRVDAEKLRRFLRIYETSSPSYPLMAGIDNALHVMETEGARLLEDLKERYLSLLGDLQRECRTLRFVPFAEGRQDPGKLVISCAGSGVTGRELARILRREYGIETEMSMPTLVLAMLTVADDAEDFQRLKKAILAVDGKLSENKEKDTDAGPLATVAPAPEAVCTIREAWDAQMQESPLAEASGKISGSFLYLYPPGTPILVPGERVGEAQIRTVERCLAAGYEVHGLGGSAKDPLVSVLRA